MSTRDQNLDLQRLALEEEGCERIYSEHVSSRKADRPQLAAALDFCRKGDVLVVWRLDRLGRSLRELIEIVNTLAENGVEFKSLTENIDTTTPTGKLVFHLVGAMAELERDLVRERTMAGLEAARARGRSGGRPKKLSDKQLSVASQLMRDRETSVTDIAEIVGVNRATLYRYLKPDGTPR